MKNRNIPNKISLALFVGLIFFLIFTYISEIHLLDIGGNIKINYYPYIRYVLATLSSVLIILIFVRRLKIYHILHLLWLFPLFLIAVNYFFGSYNTQKLDFILGKEIDDYKIYQYHDRGWIINKITVNCSKSVDTIYVSENPSWEDNLTFSKNKNKLKVVKSWITGYYYISIPKDIQDSSSTSRILPTNQ